MNFSVTEAARIFAVGNFTIRRWIHAGKLVAFTAGANGKYWISYSEMARVAAERGVRFP